MSNKSVILFILFAVLLFTSCATPLQRRQRFVASHATIVSAVKDAILRGTVIEGMSQQGVKASWGKPHRSYMKKFGSLPARHWEYDIQQPDRVDTFVLIFRKSFLIKISLKYSK